jgi:hypothetical protein
VGGGGWTGGAVAATDGWGCGEEGGVRRKKMGRRERMGRVRNSLCRVDVSM